MNQQERIGVYANRSLFKIMPQLPQDLGDPVQMLCYCSLGVSGRNKFLSNDVRITLHLKPKTWIWSSFCEC